MSTTTACRFGFVCMFGVLIAIPALVSGQAQPADPEAAAVARCDQADRLLRAGKPAEALSIVAPFVKDPTLVKSRHRGLGLYHHGFASFLLKDRRTAARSLSLLTPFNDPAYGTHARYLLGRIHHFDDERTEAGLQYEAALADHAKHKQAGRVKEVPDHIARATFYLALLLYEDGRFADAAARLTGFAQQFPRSTLVAEAQLRLGFCQVQQKQFPEAIRTLQPLVEKQPALADRALLWIGRAQAASADPANPQALKPALDTFGKAADVVRKLAATEPDANGRLGEILLARADTHQLARQPREAARGYTLLLDDKLLPERGEELLERLAAALHLAGDYAESEKICERFLEIYPRSTLLPAVLFRYAENAYLAAENGPAAGNDAARLRDEALKRYHTVTERFPEFVHASHARQARGLIFYRKGELDRAREALEAIPASDRVGDLAVASYLLADCLIRLAPAKTDDALAAGRVEEMLRTAAELLESFAGADPNGPHIPDALLKLGHCQQRRAALLSQPQQRDQQFRVARATYDAIANRFPNHPLRSQAVFEKAKCYAQAGNTARAVTELGRFRADQRLRASPVAPLAQLYLATLYRGQNNFAEAARVLEDTRKQHEPARSEWVPLLRYHHGVALMEAGKHADARAALGLVTRERWVTGLTAEAALRSWQSILDEAQIKLQESRRRLSAGMPQQQRAVVEKEINSALSTLRETADGLADHASSMRQTMPASERRARVLYDAAWACRIVAEVEVEAARARIQQEQWQKRKDTAEKRAKAAGQPVPRVEMSEVSSNAVPLQPYEEKTRAQYLKLIAAYTDLPLATEARFELAELLALRSEHESAIKLLREALDKEPPDELTDRLRLRLGACLAAKGDAKAALVQFRQVAGNAKSPQSGQALYRAAECHLQMNQPAEALKVLSAFRDKQPLMNQPGLTDRALVSLGQAHADLKQWDASRQAYELVTARFGGGPWAREARFGIGWMWQSQKQYANATRAYQQVKDSPATELAAYAQLQIGRCLMEQGKFADAAKALLVVPATYDFPEPVALAVYDAARALFRDKKNAEADKLLLRAMNDYPGTQGAALAKHALTPPPGRPRPAGDQAMLLQVFAKQLPDRVPVTDPTEEASLAAILKVVPPGRVRPVPFTPMNLPDPFERRQAVKLRVMPEEDPTPVIRLPKQ